MSQFICIKPTTSATELLSIKLPHPVTGLPARYFIQDGKLYEVQKLESQGERSWFINETVQKDGCLYIITKIDPLFVLLPILVNRRKKTSNSQGFFLLIEDLLDNNEYPSLIKLLNIVNIVEYCEWICDTKEYDTNKKVFRLNDEKVSYLVQEFDEFESLRSLIKRFDNDSLCSDIRQALRTRAVLELMSEYLPSYWIKKITGLYNFEKLAELEKANDITFVDNPSDFYARRSLEKEFDPEKQQSAAKKQKLTRSQAALAKVNTKGMKKLTTFFTKLPNDTSKK
ncbi:6342_t:CDS:10 [Ambispora gerdemannii]|uniref:Ribonuclease H2 subunit B n=1 Tax=Ambispora gerdemannii TaxID=144530 RepID=A0A9N8VSP4_9GLOM|nr:6342_t:CDS:10 [Ambispora gerdemannii]